MTALPGAQGGLRGRHAELTRTLILEALAGLLAEGVTDFSVQDVADRAGLSHRTVYRHFATREALLDALLGWLERQIVERGALAIPEHADDLPGDIRRDYRILDEFASILGPVLKLGLVDRSYRHAHRTAGFLRALAEVTSGLDPATAEAVAWTIRLLASSNTCWVLREEADIDGVHSGEAVAWAIETLIGALRAGRGPTSHEQEPSGRGS